LLHRKADSSERLGWVKALLGGTSETAIESLFLTSPEYTASHASAALFITGLYLDLFGRPAQSAGQLSIPLAGGPPRRALLAHRFLTSPEMTMRIVDGFHINLLRRPSDLAGEQGWIAMLQGNPATRSTIAEAFLGSLEFLDLATLS